MKPHLMLGALLLSCAIALPAAAQLGQVERTQAEIALEQAETQQAKLKLAREAAETACQAGEL